LVRGNRYLLVVENSKMFVANMMVEEVGQLYVAQV